MNIISSGPAVTFAPRSLIEGTGFTIASAADTSPMNCETEVEVEHLDSNLICLPLADDSVYRMNLFIKDICQPGKYNKAAQITHFSHVHPLIFVDKQIDDESPSNSKLSLFPNEFGGTLKVNKHPHLLTFVSCPKYKRPRPSCNACGSSLMEYHYALECAPCNFRLHHKCVIEEASKGAS
ncbi:hypothetical protein U1Q18_012817 [Sarracenia purpurea var. burkii]